MAELLATRTGMAPTLDTGELESRLQHFCHILEITMQTSSLAEFGGDSWAVARLYDRKVQQKVDTCQFSWVQLAEINHGASMPHELIAATQELAKKPKGGQASGKSVDVKSKGSGKENTRSGQKCFSWNKSETKGKCNLEVDTGEKCERIHECTWCKVKKLAPLHLT